MSSRPGPALVSPMVTWCSTADGGAERSVAELASELAVLCDEHIPILNSLALAGTVPNARHARYCAQLFWAIAHARRSPVLVSSHRTVLVDGPLASGLGAPVICTFRGMPVSGARFRTLDPDGELIWIDIETLVNSVPDVTWVAISNAAGTQLAQFLPSTRFVVIPNGVQLRESMRWQAGLSPSSGPLKVLVMSRAEPWKEIEVALQALAHLVHSGTRAHMTILAEGPHLAELEREAERLGVVAETRFAGWRANPFDLVSECDMLWHPARLEGFGRSVVEAAMCGRVSVVADGSGPADTVRSIGAGEVFVPGDANDLAAAAKRLAKRLNDNPGLSLQARDRAIEHYDIRRAASDYLHLAGTLRRVGEKIDVRA